jgi:ABC-type multidrug transport system permease subunit
LKGGEAVFYGDLGEKSSLLIEYFERYDATAKIQPGENPATWMLTAIGAGSSPSGDKKPFDYAGSYRQSKLNAQCRLQIDAIMADAKETNRVYFQTKYATSRETQSMVVFQRTMTVYFRSPSYNTTRVSVACIIALIFASVYASQRVPENESDMNSRINSMLMAVLFICVNAQNTVLALFECERNMFYRHKAANMYDSSAIILAFTLAELPFLFMVTTGFSVIFYFLLGFALNAAKFFIFFAFLFMGVTVFTFMGQMLVACLRDSTTAQGFGGLLVSFTSLFSGILIRSNQIPSFWIFMYVATSFS